MRVQKCINPTRNKPEPWLTLPEQLIQLWLLSLATGAGGRLRALNEEEVSVQGTIRVIQCLLRVNGRSSILDTPIFCWGLADDPEYPSHEVHSDDRTNGLG